jgi:hypothetical protein
MFSNGTAVVSQSFCNAGLYFVRTFSDGIEPTVSCCILLSLLRCTLVDSGTITLNAPNAVADAYSKLFSSPAGSPAGLGFYITECDAVGPREPFQVTINGTTFVITGQNSVLGVVPLEDNGFPGAYGNYCFIGIQCGGTFGER